MKTALSIAGSDPSGGAGIQADIKTMTLNGVYAMSVVTAMTAQNTKGVSAILETDADFLGEELDAVFEDIFPDAVKIGMAASKRIIEKTAEKLSFYNAKNIVADPVMIATSGATLIGREAVFALKEKLLPLADLITPNIPEAEALSGTDINNEYDMIKAAEKLSRELGCSVLIKGGHRKDSADDILFCDGRVVFSEAKGSAIQTPTASVVHCHRLLRQILQRDTRLKKQSNEQKSTFRECLRQDLTSGAARDRSITHLTSTADFQTDIIH